MACCLCLKTYLDTELSYISSHSVAFYDCKFSFMTLKAQVFNFLLEVQGLGFRGNYWQKLNITFLIPTSFFVYHVGR